MASRSDSGASGVTVRVWEARNLAAMDKNGKSDPYCVVTFGSHKEKTKSQKKTLDPQWGDVFTFALQDPLPPEVCFELFDWNMFSTHKRMGIARLPVKEVGINQEFAAWLPLHKVKETDNVSGDLRVQVQVNMPHVAVPDHPIFEAIRNSELDNVRKWVADPNFDVNTIDSYGYTPLHSACLIFSRFDSDILEALLKHPSVNVNVRNKENNTPLHYFCAKFRSANVQDVFDLFVAKHADVNAQNSNGETPMHKAVLNESVRGLLLQSLIKYHADCNKQSAQGGQTALHYAVHLNREDLVTLLLRGGARVDIKAGNKEPKKTPFELAVENGLTNMVRLMQRAQDINNWLKDLELDQYAPLFIKEELYKEVLPDCTEKDLERIGVAVAGHRVKLMKAIKSLSGDQLAVPPSPAPVEEKKVLSMEEQLAKMKYVSRNTKFIEHRSLEFMTKLGSGTSGVVYKGIYSGAGDAMDCAIKVLNGEQNEKEMIEFKKEFQIMSAIESPFTVFLFGCVTEPKLCMVMEFCGRGSLYHVLNDPKIDVGWKLTFQFCNHLVKGLEVLHSREPQILHRDFKSLNILVTDDFHAKVADFGTARFNTDTQSATLSKSGVGTYAYMAPEVYFGEKFTTKADLYAVGIVIWEVVYRCINNNYLRPYGEFKNVMYPVIQAAKKNLRPTIPPTCPESLSKLIASLWDKDAHTRPECAEVAERLAEIEKEWEASPETWEAARVSPGSTA